MKREGGINQMNTDNELEIAEFKLKLSKKWYGMQVNMIILNLCVLILNISVVMISSHSWFNGISIGALIISFLYIFTNLKLEYLDIKFYSMKFNNLKWKDSNEKERTENLYNLRKEIFPKDFT